MDLILNNYTPQIIESARMIKALIFDVDGVLTDGGIIYDNSGNELKKFNVKDGQIVQYLKKSGIMVGAITGRDSRVVRLRCDELKFDFHYHGSQDKITLYEEIKVKFNLHDYEIAYLGDDIPDHPIIKKCGLGVCPADALSYIKADARLVTHAEGGKGVLREVADLILASKGFFKEILA